ncbi:MAG: hypothetical protein HY983_02965 [Candidatus Magasanikbacteria bacterium]|nr:hypothetical protein [Candidatus Magasanikbacteria bacterium]
MHYFIGALAIAAGAAMIIKTEWLIQNFGTSAWAEEHLGYNGGSRLLYKLIGLIIILIGFLLVTNLFEGFLLGTIGRIFPH